MTQALTAASVMALPLDPLPLLLFAPEVSSGDLSMAERQIMTFLSSKVLDGKRRQEVLLSELYYDGLNAVPSLGISVPPELEPLRAVLGWCQAAIDARSERLNVQGFRMPGETTVNQDLQQIWQHNNLDAEAPLIHEQAMITGQAFAIIGPSDDRSGIPVITTESALNMAASWDPKKREISAAYQTYKDNDPTSATYGRQLATLYTRQATIQLSSGPNGWQVDERNDHQQNFVPVVLFNPRPTFTDRMVCRSLMTAPWRNTQDRAARTLVRMEVSSEFFAAAKLFILGASEDALQKKDGTRASAWETYVGRLSTLEADEYGNLPQIVRHPGESPEPFIRALDHERSVMAGHTGLAPQYLGIFSDGNPASADAIRMSDFRLKKIADRLSLPLGNEWERLMGYALKITGEWTDDAAQMETDWGYTGIPTPNADAVTVTTQIAAGMIPPTSDDALAKCDWSPVERARIAEERKKQEGLAQINRALAGLKQPQPNPAQPMDGQQPQALGALDSQRSTDGATAG